MEFVEADRLGDAGGVPMTLSTWFVMNWIEFI